MKLKNYLAVHAPPPNQLVSEEYLMQLTPAPRAIPRYLPIGASLLGGSTTYLPAVVEVPKTMTTGRPVSAASLRAQSQAFL
jgi:hypothetical protein